MSAANAKCGQCGWRGDSSIATSRYINGAGAGYKCPSCGSVNIHLIGDDDEQPPLGAPWSYDQSGHIRNSNGAAIASIMRDPLNGPVLAASAELLEACQMALEVLNDLRPAGHAEFETMQLLRAAIAKADGQS